MKRLGILLATAALAGCAVVHSGGAGRLGDDKGFDPDLVTHPRPTLPNVFVQNGYLVVDQEPIRLWRRDADDKATVVVAWALPARSGARWPKADAVSFKPIPPSLQCAVRPSGKVLACSFRFEPHTQYKYTLNALDGDIKLPALDPNIVNME